MTPKFKTRDVEKSLYSNYLKRAEECYHAAKNSFESQEWNATTISAIHEEKITRTSDLSRFAKAKRSP